jgi:outer membrane protein assembly factor BamB
MPNSHLIAPATGDRVHLISAATGQVEWESADIGASTTPVVGPGGIAASLFVGSTDGWIYRLALASGVQIAKLPLWNPRPNDRVRGIAYHDDVLYVTAGNSLYAVDVNDGPLWKHDMDNLAWGDPVVEGGIVFAGSWDGKLHAIHLNGTPAWIATDLNYFAAEPIVHNGVLYADAGNVIVARNAATGAMLWQATPSNDANVMGPLAVGGGRVYASTAWGGLVCAFDAATGAPLWASGAGGHPAPPTYWDERVYVCTEHGLAEGYLRAFDAATGQVLWQSNKPVGSPGDAVSSPVVDAGPATDKIFVTSQTGYAYGFDRDTGFQSWRVQIGGGWPVEPTWTAQAIVDTPSFGGFTRVDPLSLVLKADIYVKINLPYPAPVEQASVLIRKAAGGMTDRERVEALEQLQRHAAAAEMLTQAIEEPGASLGPMAELEEMVRR